MNKLNKILFRSCYVALLANTEILLACASSDLASSSLESIGIMLPNVLSAVSVVDTDGFDPPPLPKSLRGTWEDYREDRLGQFYDGSLRIIDPGLFEKRLNADELSEIEKLGRPAIDVMFDLVKDRFVSQGLLTSAEANMSWSELSPERRAALPKEALLPSRDGLSACKAVGCGQFSQEQFKNVISFIIDRDNTVKAQALAATGVPADAALTQIKFLRTIGVVTTSITLVDHREEPHLHIKGYRAKGYKRRGVVYDCKPSFLPMSLYAPGDAFSHGQDNFTVEKTEGKLVRSIQRHHNVTLSNIRSKVDGCITSGENATFRVEEAISERDLTHKLGTGYGRVPITDHSAMDGEDADFLRMAYDGQSPETYVIHHCRGGKGRTQTGLITRDMMRNADKNLTLADFVLRHVLIGGSNLLGPLTGSAEDEWKALKSYERAREIANFFNYTRESPKGVRVLYRAWKEKQGGNRTRLTPRNLEKSQ